MNEQLSHNKEDNALFTQIKYVLDEARRHVARSVNTTIVNAYWQVGKYIVEYEQDTEGKKGGRLYPIPWREGAAPVGRNR